MFNETKTIKIVGEQLLNSMRIFFEIVKPESAIEVHPDVDPRLFYQFGCHYPLNPKLVKNTITDSINLNFAPDFYRSGRNGLLNDQIQFSDSDDDYTDSEDAMDVASDDNTSHYDIPLDDVLGISNPNAMDSLNDPDIVAYDPETGESFYQDELDFQEEMTNNMVEIGSTDSEDGNIYFPM